MVGNDAVVHATELIYGKFISKILLLAIIIAVLGVSNGMLLGTMRLPQAFASLGWIDNPKFAKIDLKYQLSIPASLCFWSDSLLARYPLLGQQIQPLTRQ